MSNYSPKVITHHSDWTDTLQLNTGGVSHGVYEFAINRLYQEMIKALQHHKEVLAVSFQLQFQEGVPLTPSLQNDLITKFFKSIKEKLSYKPKKAKESRNPAYLGHSNIGHAWCRENETAKNYHFHVWLFLDGRNGRCTARGINNIAEEEWLRLVPNGMLWRLRKHDVRKQLGGAYIAAKHNGYRYSRTENGYEEFYDALYHASYIAKNRGKGYGDSEEGRKNNFGFSRLQQLVDIPDPMADEIWPYFGTE